MNQENTARQFELTQRVRLTDSGLQVDTEDGLLALPSETLPDRCIDWIEQGRRAMYDKLQGKGNPAFFTSHLPVLITYAKGQPFPFNCGNKGVGYLPKPQYLQEYINLFRDTIARTKGRPWQESMHDRLEAVSSFYFNREVIDYRALSSLEIFEKSTFNNLARTPLAALHYTGNAPDYLSFQVNAAVEIIGPEDPRHEFVKLARVMFEYDSFHIAQHQFPYAYVFWISSVLDKTPFRVPEKEKGGNVITLATKGGMQWAPEAIESINRAPGMIRQFITEQIEKYASQRGFKEITMELVREAREILERTPPEKSGEAKPKGEGESQGVSGKYSRIYVGLDSSELSNAAMDLAMGIGKHDQAQMIGSHVYAAKMHDNRFRAMEGGLPEEFQKEKELNRQRKIHDSLITKGLELITDSYLETMGTACRKESLPFTAVSLEGKNWRALAEDIEAHDYDLIALGAHGVGRVGSSQLGTVAERVLRRVRRDVLLCKLTEAENTSDTIVVCLDGSTRSWGGLERAMQLAKSFGKKILAVSAFDPYFHYAMFKSLNKTLTEKARKVFKFEEQETLHEDIIDSGLAKIYQSYLNIAKRLAGEQGVDIEIKLLDGKPFEKILQLVRKSAPWLLVVGRVGFHSDEEMDIGGNTENICRLAPCNILVVDAKAKPPVEFQAAETVSWTKEARSRMDRVPAMAQNVAIQAIQNYCVAEGHTVVTESILTAALKTLLPPEALARMGIVDDTGETKEELDKISLSFKCQACGHVHHGSRPQACPICGMGGHMFKLIESEIIADGQSQQALGQRNLVWEKSALEELDDIGDAILREQVRNRLEKRSLTQRITSVTLAMVREEREALFAAGELVWTEAALERLARVPEGFMRNAAKGMIETHAKGNGQNEITLEIAEAGLGKARQRMQEGMAGGGGHPESIPGGPASASTSGSAMSGADSISNSVADTKEKSPVDTHGGEQNSSLAPQTWETGSSTSPENSSASWECHLCGLIVDGLKPAVCPGCATAHFIKVTPEQRAQAKPSAFLKLEWEPAALARLDRVPAGFIRDMTRCRIEKWARASGDLQVTVVDMDGKYGSWGDGSAKVKSELDWQPEALTRMEKIPGFVRPMVMKEIERRAKAENRNVVLPSDIDEAVAHWSKTGNFHGHG